MGIIHINNNDNNALMLVSWHQRIFVNSYQILSINIKSVYVTWESKISGRMNAFGISRFSIIPNVLGIEDIHTNQERGMYIKLYLIFQ